MLQSIIVILGIVVALVFYFDIRRRGQAHTRAVQKERDAIAEATHSTATLSSFSDGRNTEVLLGASEDSGLFFYRRIDKGVLVVHYTVRINNIVQAVLMVDGEKCEAPSESGHMTAQMRATEIARQARQALSQDTLKLIKHIRLTIVFRSDDGSEKNIPVTIYHSSQGRDPQMLAKAFENGVWWQQYLTQISSRRSEADLITFKDQL